MSQQIDKNSKKLCFKKCKDCAGVKCPNYYGHLGTKQDYKNYNGVLHSRKIRFSDDVVKRVIMDRGDWHLVYFLIVLVCSLLFFGGMLP